MFEKYFENLKKFKEEKEKLGYWVKINVKSIGWFLFFR